MQYKLNNLLPHPLKEQKRTHPSDIWERECILDNRKKYLVIAPSGKGKSTFLHILYGLRKDYTGQVALDEQKIEPFTQEQWATLRKDHLSIVFQDLRLFPKLSALDNILIKNQLHHAKTEGEIKEMANKLGIDSLLHQSCGTLSYGQRQRVAIIRALCQPFDFLFLDEPFSHLDDDNTNAALELIQSICAEQATGFILVSLGEQFGITFDQALIL